MNGPALCRPHLEIRLWVWVCTGDGLGDISRRQQPLQKLPSPPVTILSLPTRKSTYLHLHMHLHLHLHPPSSPSLD